MKKIATAILVSALAFTGIISTAAHAGNCDYSWQYAKDGSSCGNRAADRR